MPTSLPLLPITQLGFFIPNPLISHLSVTTWLLYCVCIATDKELCDVRFSLFFLLYFYFLRMTLAVIVTLYPVFPSPPPPIVIPSYLSLFIRVTILNKRMKSKLVTMMLSKSLFLGLDCSLCLCSPSYTYALVLIMFRSKLN